jgi:hypothetical protein
MLEEEVVALGYEGDDIRHGVFGAWVAAVLPTYENLLINQMRPEEQEMLKWDGERGRWVGLCGWMQRKVSISDAHLRACLPLERERGRAELDREHLEALIGLSGGYRRPRVDGAEPLP